MAVRLVYDRDRVKVGIREVTQEIDGIVIEIPDLIADSEEELFNIYKSFIKAFNKTIIVVDRDGNFIREKDYTMPFNYLDILKNKTPEEKEQMLNELKQDAENGISIFDKIKEETSGT